MEGKVLPFSGKSALFTDRQRQGISHRLTEYTDRPAEATSAVESEICRQLVIMVREVSTTVGNLIGHKLAKMVFKS